MQEQEDFLEDDFQPEKHHPDQSVPNVPEVPNLGPPREVLPPSPLRSPIDGAQGHDESLSEESGFFTHASQGLRSSDHSSESPSRTLSHSNSIESPKLDAKPRSFNSFGPRQLDFRDILNKPRQYDDLPVDYHTLSPLNDTQEEGYDEEEQSNQLPAGKFLDPGYNLKSSSPGAARFTEPLCNDTKTKPGKDNNQTGQIGDLEQAKAARIENIFKKYGFSKPEEDRFISQSPEVEAYRCLQDDQDVRDIPKSISPRIKTLKEPEYKANCKSLNKLSVCAPEINISDAEEDVPVDHRKFSIIEPTMTRSDLQERNEIVSKLEKLESNKPSDSEAESTNTVIEPSIVQQKKEKGSWKDNKIFQFDGDTGDKTKSKTPIEAKAIHRLKRNNSLSVVAEDPRCLSPSVTSYADSLENFQHKSSTTPDHMLSSSTEPQKSLTSVADPDQASAGTGPIGKNCLLDDDGGGGSLFLSELVAVTSKVKDIPRVIPDPDMDRVKGQPQPDTSASLPACASNGVEVGTDSMASHLHDTVKQNRKNEIHKKKQKDDKCSVS